MKTLNYFFKQKWKKIVFSLSRICLDFKLLKYTPGIYTHMYVYVWTNDEYSARFTSRELESVILPHKNHNTFNDSLTVYLDVLVWQEKWVHCVATICSPTNFTDNHCYWLDIQCVSLHYKCYFSCVWVTAQRIKSNTWLPSSRHWNLQSPLQTIHYQTQQQMDLKHMSIYKSLST